MRLRTFVLAAALALAPTAVRAADLVVWWEAGRFPGEDRAVEEIVTAFEKKTGKDVELVFYPELDLEAKTLAALAARRPPDFLFGLDISPYYGQWAREGRLANLSDAIGPFAAQFDQDALERVTLAGATGKRALHALPMGRTTWHLHVWHSLLERAGLTRADVPRQWQPFWSFWCDRAQPALREALDRDDVYGVALQMSISSDTHTHFEQFVAAHGAHYVTREGDPHRMASAMQFLTRPRLYDYAAVSGEWRHRKVEAELVWAKAIHSTVTQGVSPEQAVDEAIARVKQTWASDWTRHAVRAAVA